MPKPTPAEIAKAAVEWLNNRPTEPPSKPLTPIENDPEALARLRSRIASTL